MCNMVATRCIKCTAPLDAGGQYCDACKPAPFRPRSEPVSVSTTPPEVTETGQCSNCRREVEADQVCDCVTLVEARADVHFAGFFVRAAAFCTDWLALGAIGVVTVFLTNSPWTALIVMVAAGLVGSVGFWLADGATPGKMLFRLKVRMANGEDIEPVAAVLRYFAYLASGVMLGIGFLIMLFDDENRGLHDVISNTIVIAEGDR
jgi:uncharacterized RDD family membrane protein YckC